MHAIRVCRFGRALAAFGSMAVVAAAQVPPQQGLVRIPKQQAVEAPADRLADLVPVEEFETVWIARATAETVTALRSRSVALQELPVPAAGHAYYVVYDPSPADLERLRTRGNVLAADPSAWLFLTREQGVRDAIPRQLFFKRLTGEVAGPVRLRSPVASRATGAPASRRETAPASPEAAALAAQVSRERLQESIAELESFVSRYASTASCEAAGTYVLEHFRRVGLAAEADDFTVGGPAGYTTSNIIATLPGRADPGRVVIISAHYDSYSDQRPTLAPGADDDASGTAAVMEAARLLSAQPFDFTVRFIAFGAEEWGLLGSQRYVQLAQQRGEQIVAVLSLDLIGYADRLPEDLDIVASIGSLWLADRLAAMGAAVGPIASATQVRWSFGSDCSPFWQAGFASVCGIEDFPLTNPHYHRVTDRLETLNLDLVTAITRTAVATVAELAQPVSTPPPPAGLVVQSRDSTSLFLRGRTVWLEWHEPGAETLGYHVYRASTSHGAYRRLTSSPLREASYSDFVDPRESLFYVVTAVDQTGRESNYSGEVGVIGDLAATTP